MSYIKNLPPLRKKSFQIIHLVTDQTNLYECIHY